jgi:glutathione S-transferase
MQLYIGNKNYSSWSLRPWLLMTHSGIAFEEVKLRIAEAEDSPFKTTLAAISPAGRVPVLVDDGLSVWESLAIVEYLAERFPDKALWPADVRARAHARSICSEIHAGFGALRNHCPMNIEASMPEVGARLLETQPELAMDLQRIGQMWTGLLAEHGGPFLFGAFSIADAFYAPVCTRVRTYGLSVPPAASAYVERIFALPAMQAWVKAARAEQDFLPFDEPYRTAPA